MSHDEYDVDIECPACGGNAVEILDWPRPDRWMRQGEARCLNEDCRCRFRLEVFDEDGQTDRGEWSERLKRMNGQQVGNLFFPNGYDPRWG